MGEQMINRVGDRDKPRYEVELELNTDIQGYESIEGIAACWPVLRKKYPGDSWDYMNAPKRILLTVSLYRFPDAFRGKLQKVRAVLIVEMGLPDGSWADDRTTNLPVYWSIEVLVDKKETNGERIK